jgi:hypothetical protein
VAQSQASKEYSTFTKGLVTEASPLTFPEGAAIDLDNVNLQRDGSIQRRLGVDVTSTTAYSSETQAIQANYPLATYLWRNPANIANTTFLVSVRYNEIVVKDVSTTTDWGTATVVPWVSDPSASTTASVMNNTSDFPTVFRPYAGHLILTGGRVWPSYLTYNPDTGEVERTLIEFSIRDLKGIDMGATVDDRPTTLTESHYYNLLNQGWDDDKLDATFAEVSIAAYPSNADVWYVARDPTDDSYNPTKLVNQVFGTAAAPKGKNILRLFTQERQINIAEYIKVRDKGRPQALAFYAGRAWWSGIRSSLEITREAGVVSTVGKTPTIEVLEDDPDLYPDCIKDSHIYFSQIPAKPSDLGKCYQDNDPTSEFQTGVLATDGGYLTIPEASNIVALEELQNGLVVFAENGVWFITGTDGNNFSPTDYSVKKVSDIGTKNPESVVRIEGTLMYWAETGIYALSPDKVQALLIAQNISENVIASFYDNISLTAKAAAKGCYDPISREVLWVFSNDNIESTTKYDKHYALVYNVLLQAFYTHSFSYGVAGDAPVILSVLSDWKGAATEYFENITDTGYATVTTSTLAEVTMVGRDIEGRGGEGFVFVVARNNAGNQELFRASYVDDSFVDFRSFDNAGASFESFIETGYELFGDSQRKKQIRYITCHLTRTETGFDVNLNPLNPSSCMMQVKWDWTNSAASGKWSTAQEVYRYNRLYVPVDNTDDYDTGYRTIVTKNKLRGRGRSLAVKWASSEGKDMKLLGWGVIVTGEQDV